MRLYGRAIAIANGLPIFRHATTFRTPFGRNACPLRPKQTSISADGDMRFGRKGIFMSLPHQAKASTPMIW